MTLFWHNPGFSPDGYEHFNIDIRNKEEIEKILQPQETLLVADALTGQDAANIAKSFSEAVRRRFIRNK